MKCCIGKATRYKDGDVVTEPTVSVSENYSDFSFYLRSLIFDSRETAQIAANEAKYANPVGFVVLNLVEQITESE